MERICSCGGEEGYIAVIDYKVSLSPINVGLYRYSLNLAILASFMNIVGCRVASLNGKSVLGRNCEKFEYFPILIKLIDAKDNLSVQQNHIDPTA